MERRNFLKQNVLAGGSLLTGSAVLAQYTQGDPMAKAKVMDDSVPFKLQYAIHDGMFENLAGPNFIDQIKYAHSIGFTAIEDNGMMSRTPEMQKK